MPLGQHSGSLKECAPSSNKQGKRDTCWDTMKHGGSATVLSLVLAFAHHVRLCAPFSSVAPWQSSSARARPSQAGTHRSARALEAASTSETIARREDMLQAKRVAKEKLVAQRVSVSVVSF